MTIAQLAYNRSEANRKEDQKQYDEQVHGGEDEVVTAPGRPDC